MMALVYLVLGFFAIVVGWPAYLYHRRCVLRFERERDEQWNGLLDRLDEMDARYEELRERVLDAHVLLADEQRRWERDSVLLSRHEKPASDRRSREALRAV